ncbi:hypothetical protein B0H10DRAFT_1978656 [Mycena sp. CBHHK59/15]|nr:hypothetical protein B0H10DRAFT_1978656 [Mycena sp. CBHHK59/15]
MYPCTAVPRSSNAPTAILISKGPTSKTRSHRSRCYRINACILTEVSNSPITLQLASKMKLLALGYITCGAMSTLAIHVVRDDASCGIPIRPSRGGSNISTYRQSITTTYSIYEVFPPSSTDPADVAAYQHVQQSCGHDVDVALQDALQDYKQQFPGNDNTTVSNPTFQEWANTEWSALVTANTQCELNKENYWNIDDADRASATSTTSTTLVDSSTAAPSATVVSSAQSSASTTALPGRAIVHNPRLGPIVFLAGLLVMLVRLN